MLDNACSFPHHRAGGVIHEVERRERSYAIVKRYA